MYIYIHIHICVFVCVCDVVLCVFVLYICIYVCIYNVCVCVCVFYVVLCVFFRLVAVRDTARVADLFCFCFFLFFVGGLFVIFFLFFFGGSARHCGSACGSWRRRWRRTGNSLRSRRKSSWRLRGS